MVTQADMVQKLLKVRGADDDGAEEAMKDTWTPGAAEGGAVGEAGGDVKEVWEEPAEIDYEGTSPLTRWSLANYSIRACYSSLCLVCHTGFDDDDDDDGAFAAPSDRDNLPPLNAPADPASSELPDAGVAPAGASLHAEPSRAEPMDAAAAATTTAAATAAADPWASVDAVDTYDPRTLERSVAQPPTPTPPTAAAHEQQQPLQQAARVDATGGRVAATCDVRPLLASLCLEEHWPALSEAGLGATAELRRQQVADAADLGRRLGRLGLRMGHRQKLLLALERLS